MGRQAEFQALRIGTLARRAGMSQQTVRYYERLGLVRRPARTENGYRVYSSTDLGRLLFVRRAKLLGLPLAEIRPLVELAEEGECQPVRRRVAELLQEKLAACEETLAQLRAFKAGLEERYKAALKQENDSESICATFPTSCDCLPVALHEIEAVASHTPQAERIQPPVSALRPLRRGVQRGPLPGSRPGASSPLPAG